jgi:hypothetical protein
VRVKDCHLLVVSKYLKKIKELPRIPFFKGINLFMRAPLSWLYYLPKTPPLTPRIYDFNI